MSTLYASNFVAGFPDAAKVWKQVNCCNADTLDAAMSNLAATKRRIKAGCEGVDRVYIDLEPGGDNPGTVTMEGWLRKDVQAFAIDILNDQPCALFPGAIFSQLVDRDLPAAKAVHDAASLGLFYPAYCGPGWTLDRYDAAWRSRLKAMDNSGLLDCIVLSRTCTGPDKMRVPDDLFAKIVSYCADFCEALLVWSWDGDTWSTRAELETRTVFRSGDEELAVFTAAASQAEADAANTKYLALESGYATLASTNLDLSNILTATTAERDATRAEAVQLTADLEAAKTWLAAVRAKVAELQAVL